MTGFATSPYKKQRFLDVLNELDHWSDDEAETELLDMTGMAQRMDNLNLDGADLYEMFNWLLNQAEKSK